MAPASDERGGIDDIAQPEVEMAVHSLQSRDHQTVRRRWHAKRIPPNQNHPGTFNQARGDCDLFSSLAQAAHVNLDFLG